jgi:hypothetical protein
MFCPNLKKQIRFALREFDAFVDAHITTALAVTRQMKAVLASPVTDIITAIIPGDIDEAIRKQLLVFLDKSVEALAIADTCRLHTDLNDKLKCFMQQLRLRDPELQDAILLKLASLIAGNLDGQRFRRHLYDLYTQAKFSSAR